MAMNNPFACPFDAKLKPSVSKNYRLSKKYLPKFF